MKNSIITYILTFLLALLTIVILEAARVEPAELSDVQRLTTYIQQNSTNVNEVTTMYGMPIFAADLRAKVKLLPEHDDFWWKWEIHTAFIWWVDRGECTIYVTRLGFTVKQYQGATSPSFVNVTVWNLFDYDQDGIVDYWYREFLLELEDEEVIFPQYPDGFVTKNWRIPVWILPKLTTTR